MHTYKSFTPLTAENFKPFGDVLETENHPFELINNGFTQKYPVLSKPEMDQKGFSQIHIFRANPYPMPFTLRMLEKHPLGSQTFLPTRFEPFLIIVAPARETIVHKDIQAFITNGFQGITYHAGVWHHPVMSYRTVSDFFVVDRGGDDTNLVEHHFDEPLSFHIGDFPTKPVW